MSIAKTGTAPYYAVIFTSVRTEEDNGHQKMADAMFELAAKQPGYLGVESAGEDFGITVSYWESLEAIAAWKENVAHVAAQRLGRDAWYSMYKTRVCRVERDYVYEASQNCCE
ncbi:MULTISPECIES: antibiotic biosynthesis monooxygenase family protein [Burkholderia]|uniref:JEMB protein n=1 Tax=Burkholderia mayonis TaxID=1385591 RepID=A0A1B4FPN7_9BURK|nr:MULTISPECIES: antibiotic biosynthesis monooxygenase [Burkholderia]AOJ05589.1 JEMB protein [Burkholderia mayonis]KVE34698.1 JEMB protein [Burkholderia sp. BDU5]KVE43980.1 JEMB protein [Burkholderia mayonis]